MTITTELAQRMREAAVEELMFRTTCDTSDLWQDEASPENVLALLDALEAKDKQITELEGKVSALEGDVRTTQYQNSPRCGICGGNL